MDDKLGRGAKAADSDADAGGRKRRSRGGLVLMLGAVVLALGAVILALTLQPRAASTGGSDDTAAYARLGGPFRMTDQTGRAVDQSVLKGKWSAIFFGYVTCPDICPTTLQALANTQAALGKDGDRFQVVFVSVDPKRDTPDLIQAYLDQPGYPPRAVGLTGTADQVAAIAKAYRAYYAYVPRSEKDGGGYDVSHSGAIYLVDPRGVTVGALTEAMGPQAMAAQVERAMKARG